MRGREVLLLLTVLAVVVARAVRAEYLTPFCGANATCISKASPELAMRPPQDPKEDVLVDTVVRLSAEFVDHLRLKYARDPRASAIIAKWTGDVQIVAGRKATDVIGGVIVAASYNKKNGRMLVNPNVESVFVPERLNYYILHELAHSRGSGHDSTWRQTWHFFLRVATTELGWKCAIRQRFSCEKYSLCHRDQCPRCLWE